MNTPTAEFIRLHAHDDVKTLALQGARNADVDMSLALNQIAGRQAAQKKLPAWAAVDAILYPPHLSMEQCSSEPTARYKAELAAKAILNVRQSSSSVTLVDLTGGFGVDFSYMARAFQQAVYVERQAHLCELARHNLTALGVDAEVRNEDAETYLQEMGDVTMVFMDPARRDNQGGRTYGIADCTPNVLEMLPSLLQKAEMVMLKLSPMLDWKKTVSDLNGVLSYAGHVESGVLSVHIVAVDNECKELLVLIGRKTDAPLKVVCKNDDTVFEYTPTSEQVSAASYVVPQSGHQLYVPNAALMKAGCFSELEHQYGVHQIAVNSHLMVSDVRIADFPGRQFTVDTVSTMNKKELREALKDIRQANVAVRNFPMSVDELRKRLKIKEGGSVFIFATTLTDQKRVLLVCSKK